MSYLVPKSLNGDGSLTITKICPKKGNPYYLIQGNISDKDMDHLNDYIRIFKNLGIHSRLDLSSSNRRVIFSSSLESLFYYFKIRAFKNNPNWYKLLYAIKIGIDGKKGDHFKKNSRILRNSNILKECEIEYSENLSKIRRIQERIG